MADWTANSSFGALSASRDPRAARDVGPKANGPRAERFGPHKPGAEPRMPSAHAALAEYNAAEGGGPLAKARVIAWGLGGALSLGLVAGIGVWGYKVVLREVLGLPVVAAAEGPMRVLPADPGGQVVPSQGLAVNEIPAAGTAAPPSDVLMLAPPAPGLAEEDMEVVLQTRAEEGEVLASDAPDAPVPGGSPVAIVPSNRALTIKEMQDVGARGTVAATSPAPAAPVEALSQAASVAATELPQATVIIPPPPPEAPALADEAATVEVAPEAAATTASVEAAPAEEALVATVTVISADVPGVAAALRPLTRPVRSVALSTSAEAPEPAPAVAAPEPAASAAVPAGTALIQLGAYDSAEIAAAEWDRLQSEFGEFLGDKDRVIQEAQSGGRTFYRLRAAGFADRSDANRLCAALTAENADCIPVRAD